MHNFPAEADGWQKCSSFIHWMDFSENPVVCSGNKDGNEQLKDSARLVCQGYGDQRGLNPKICVWRKVNKKKRSKVEKVHQKRTAKTWVYNTSFFSSYIYTLTLWTCIVQQQTRRLETFPNGLRRRRRWTVLLFLQQLHGESRRSSHQLQAIMKHAKVIMTWADSLIKNLNAITLTTVTVVEVVFFDSVVNLKGIA